MSRLLAIALLLLVGWFLPIGDAAAQESGSCVWTSSSSPEGCPDTFPTTSAALDNCQYFVSSHLATGWTLQTAAYGGGNCAAKSKASPGPSTCYYGAVQNVSGSAINGYFCALNAVSDPDCEALADQYNDPSSPDYIDPATGGSSTVVGDGSRCVGGCLFKMQGPKTQIRIGGTLIATTGYASYSGEACPAPPDTPPPTEPPAKPTDAACKPAANGQTYCVQQDGQQCYPASTGRMICWGPGQTGTKTDGPIAQNRGPGSTLPPAPTPPPGETVSATGPSAPGSTQNQTSTGTIISQSTTIVQNYVTNYGTNAGTSNEGQPSGSTSGGSSEIGGETGTVSGDGSCDSQYTITGGDPVANKILQEIHAENCAARDEYTYQGDGLDDRIADGDGTGDVDAADLFSTGEAASPDMSGFGASGTCPTIPDLGPLGVIPQEKFCLLIQVLGWLFVALAIGWGKQVIFG